MGAEGFSAFYNLVVGLSTMAAVIPYAFCALAGSLVSARVSGGARVPRVTHRRDRGLRVRHVHALRLRRGAGPLRAGAVAARYSGVRLAAATHERD